MATVGKPPLNGSIRSALAEVARIEIAEGDDALYSRFRCLEPELVSCLDADNGSRPKRPNILAAYLDGIPAGVASWVGFQNDCRKEKANLYARVDLVIVRNECRRLGIARLLTLSTLMHIIETHGERIYSISCLAAHAAMEAILERLGFSGDVRPGHHFKHESIRTDQLDINDWAEHLAGLLTSAGRMTSYRIRQNEVSATL